VAIIKQKSTESRYYVQTPVEAVWRRPCLGSNRYSL